MQQRVLADATVLEERLDRYPWGRTPEMYAIDREKPAIALWLIGHHGRHDVNTADHTDNTALHYAPKHGPLEVVEALVAASANSAAVGRWAPPTH